jgi:hypothetical protein
LSAKKIVMTNGNDVNDVNSPVQTQEPEVGEGELQVGSSRVDAGEKSDESSTNVRASLVTRSVEKSSELGKSLRNMRRLTNTVTFGLVNPPSR